MKKIIFINFYMVGVLLASSILDVFARPVIHSFENKVQKSNIIFVAETVSESTEKIKLNVIKVIKGGDIANSVEVKLDLLNSPEQKIPTFKLGDKLIVFANQFEMDSAGLSALITNPLGIQKLELKVEEYEIIVKSINDYATAEPKKKAVILEQLLRSNHDFVRLQSLHMIYKDGVNDLDSRKELIGLVNENLRSKNSMLVVAAIQASKRLAAKETVSELIELIGSENIHIRESAIASVSDLLNKSLDVSKDSSQKQREEVKRELLIWWAENRENINIIP